jgi:hypothetical protein
VEHWRAGALPADAWFDKDTRVQGPPQDPDPSGTVIRLCLSLGGVPVFAIPHDMGIQAAIERLNGQWQPNVWACFHHPSVEALQAQLTTYGLASGWQGAPAAHLLSVLSHRLGLTLWPQAMADKTNEMPVLEDVVSVHVGVQSK